jgi:hypothetical protein
MGQAVGALICESVGDAAVDSAYAVYALGDHVSKDHVVPIKKSSMEEADDMRTLCEIVLPEPESSHAYANLIFYVLNPLFKRQGGFLMREALRLMGKKTMTYCAQTGEPLQDVLEIFTQVRPRFIPSQPASGILLPSNAEREEVLKTPQSIIDDNTNVAANTISMPTPPATEVGEGEDAKSYALHVLSRRMLSRAKITINSRIIVVGASNVGLAFLEALLLLPDINFTHLTLLSRTGLPMSRTSSKQHGQFLSWDLNYDCEKMQRLAVESRVQVVANVMTHLDRDHKTVSMADGTTLSYDFCVLTPGLQDQTRRTVVDSAFTVEGIFSLTNEDDVVDFMSFVEHEQAAEFVVYGNSLAALCAIRGLLDIDVTPSAIVWAHPCADTDGSWCDGDREVLDRVLAGLKKQGVKIMTDMKLVGIKERNGKVTHAVLQSLLHRTAEDAADEDDIDSISGESFIECQVLLGCDTPDIDANIFDAFTANSLVYDGRAVVNAAFGTADSSIFAAGTFAKFSRRYGNRQLAMEHYDSREIGKRLAESMLRFMDPAVMSVAEIPVKPPVLGVRPKTHEGLLPGGFNYFLSKKPSFDAIKKPIVLATQKEGSMCRMEFDDYNVLHSISYIGAEAVQGRNIREMIGMPGTYLNRVLHRYAEDEVSDLVEFVQAPWTTALFHENFAEVRAALSHSVSKEVSKMSDLTNGVMEMLQERHSGTAVDTSKLSSLMETMPLKVREMIQIRLLEFLQSHANHLKYLQIPSYN